MKSKEEVKEMFKNIGKELVDQTAYNNFLLKKVNNIMKMLLRFKNRYPHIWSETIVDEDLDVIGEDYRGKKMVKTKECPRCNNTTLNSSNIVVLEDEDDPMSNMAIQSSYCSACNVIITDTFMLKHISRTTEKDGEIVDTEI